MDIIERIINSLLRRNKKPSGTNSDYEFINQRQMESMAGTPAPSSETDSSMNQRQMEAAASAPPPYAGGSGSNVSAVNLETGVTTTYMNSGAVVAQAPGKTPYQVKSPDNNNEPAVDALSARSQAMNEAHGLGAQESSSKAVSPMSGSEALQRAGLDGTASSVESPAVVEASASAAAAADAAAASPYDQEVATANQLSNNSSNYSPAVMSQEEALRSAGLDMNFSGIPEPSTVHSVPVTEGSPAERPILAEAANSAAASPYDQEVLTANHLSQGQRPAQTLAEQRLEQGRQHRLDPDGSMFGGGADFGIAGPTENPVDSFGGASGDHQAV